MIDADTILALLEEKCETCAASGQNHTVVKGRLIETYTCRDCRGTGKVLTDLGREVIDFVKRHLP